MGTGALGKVYQNGEIIVRQGEVESCMYVIQEGMVELFQERDGKEVHLEVLQEGDFFGETAIVEREVRSVSVRALGDTRVLTVDKKTFLRRVQEDPSLAFRILEKLSYRIRDLNTQIAQLSFAMLTMRDVKPGEK